MKRDLAIVRTVELLFVIFVLCLCAGIARADPPWRVKVDSYADGELTSWPKSKCSQSVVDNLQRVVKKYPYIELIDGKMAARIDEKRPVPAQRQVLGSAFSAYYDVTETRTIVFTIRWQSVRVGKDGKDGTVPVEVSIIERTSAGSCRETWLGLGKRI